MAIDKTERPNHGTHEDVDLLTFVRRPDEQSGPRPGVNIVTGERADGSIVTEHKSRPRKGQAQKP
jgi:hypothetical protein